MSAAPGALAMELAPALWPVDKPAGPSSHDVVAGVRRRLGRGVKVGHTGTLDPFASGLLVLLTGRATRLADYLSGLDKTYVATLRTGARSATGDPEGPIEPGGPPAAARDLELLLPELVGPQLQRVPAYAAVKVGGERLYRRTRRGEQVERPEREITIHSLGLVEDRGGGDLVLQVSCSKGTYIRQLAADIGERLGCGAYCLELRRTRVGSLSLEEAVAPDAVAAEGGWDPLAALGHLERRELSPAELAEVAHGRPLAGRARGPVALVADGRLAAIARPDGTGRLRPAVVLAEPGGGEPA